MHVHRNWNNQPQSSNTSEYQPNRPLTNNKWRQQAYSGLPTHHNTALYNIAPSIFIFKTRKYIYTKTCRRKCPYSQYSRLIYRNKFLAKYLNKVLSIKKIKARQINQSALKLAQQNNNVFNLIKLSRKRIPIVIQ